MKKILLAIFILALLASVFYAGYYLGDLPDDAIITNEGFTKPDSERPIKPRSPWQQHPRTEYSPWPILDV